MKRVMMDVDTGIDDSLALLYLLAHPDVEIVGIASTAGNVPAPQVAANNLAWLDVAKAGPIEVALGSLSPLLVPLVTTEDTHGPQGIGYAELPPSSRSLSSRTAAELWIDVVRAHPGEVVGLVTGPLTNLALALKAEPELPLLLARLVVMGGAINYPGNTTPTTEWNVFVDPEAAKVVFDAFSVVPADRRPILCSLDMTETIEMHPEHVARLAEIAGSTPVETPAPDDPATTRSATSNPIVRYFTDAVRFYMTFHLEHDQGYLAHMHDPFAAAVAVDPSIVETRPVTVDVELSGALTRGMTVADHAGMWGRPPNVETLTRTDPAAFFDMLLERIGSWARAVYS